MKEEVTNGTPNHKRYGLRKKFIAGLLAVVAPISGYGVYKMPEFVAAKSEKSQQLEQRRLALARSAFQCSLTNAYMVSDTAIFAEMQINKSRPEIGNDLTTEWAGRSIEADEPEIFSQWNDNAGNELRRAHVVASDGRTWVQGLGNLWGRDKAEIDFFSIGKVKSYELFNTPIDTSYVQAIESKNYCGSAVLKRVGGSWAVQVAYNQDRAAAFTQERKVA